MDDLQKQQLYGQIKIVITYFLGWAVGKKYIDNEVAASLVGMVSLIVPMAVEYFQKRSVVKQAANAGAQSVDPTTPIMSTAEAVKVTSGTGDGK